MKAVKVQYSVQPSFADTNAANIRKVMDALKANPIDGVTYVAFRLNDNQTFVHIVVARDDAAQAKVSDLPEFKAFQATLKASNPVTPPSPEDLDLVGASFDI